MDQLIETIRVATTSSATTEQKAAAVQACHAIIAALATEPGKPIVLPGTPPRSPLAGISADQMLDLLIARLTMVANARETTPAPALPPATPPPAFRVPAVATPRTIARAASNARPANIKRPIARKP